MGSLVCAYGHVHLCARQHSEGSEPPMTGFFLTSECELISAKHSVLVLPSAAVRGTAHCPTPKEAVGQIWRKCPTRPYPAVLGCGPCRLLGEERPPAFISWNVSPAASSSSA